MQLQQHILAHIPTKNIRRAAVCVGWQLTPFTSDKLGIGVFPEACDKNPSTTAPPHHAGQRASFRTRFDRTNALGHQSLTKEQTQSW